MLILKDENIKIISVNDKTIKDRAGRIRNNPEYNKFIDRVAWSCKKIKLKKYYKVIIIVYTWKDISNFEKPILDGVEKSGVIDNDGNVINSGVFKVPIKRGRKEKLYIFVHTIRLDVVKRFVEHIISEE